MIIEEISLALQKGKANDVKALVQQALAEGYTPKDILEKGLIQGMNVIGGKFKRNEVFVPEVLVAARAMNAGQEILRPVLVKSGIKPIGKAVICTVQGDLHDIGKNLVKMMLEGQAIACVDLGVDVPAEKVIAAIKEYEPDLLCLPRFHHDDDYAERNHRSREQSRSQEQGEDHGRGAPVTEKFALEIKADGYAPDAASAAELAVQLIGEMHV